jgi:nitric oxide dioxygenase
MQRTSNFATLMMTHDQKQLIKSTVPVLKEHGLALTTHFYQRLFAHNPEFKNVFNQGNQQNGHQPMALATAVLAYAEHIADPSVLGAALNRIGHKHTSLDIRPEHYAIIGRHLLASIGEVLGEAATPDLLDAWGAAYAQLSRLMIGTEADLYAAQLDKPGGWTGWRPFVVSNKIEVSDEMTAFHLYPADGGRVADHLPGQYLSVRLFLPGMKLLQPRQYTIINAPNQRYYCITVNRMESAALTTNNLINKQLRNDVREGDHVDVSAPAGIGPVASKAEKPVLSATEGGCPMHHAVQNATSEHA